MNETVLRGAIVAGSSRGELAESEVLNGVAMMATMRRASRLPEDSGPAVVPPAEKDTRPVLDVGLGTLNEALNLDINLAVEWCQTAAEHGWRLPDAYLPKILDAMAKTSGLWTPALPVLGERGRWLASLNPAWATIRKRDVSEDRDELRARWPEATGAERQAILDRLGEDHEAIREFAASTWKTDSAKTRLQTVEALANHAQPADADFLLSCLTDRSLEVRAQAAKGAARLRIPSFEEEVFALAQEFVTVEPNFAVRMPEMDDKRFERFGMASVKGAVHAYQRQGRFYGLISLVPPSRWVPSLQAAPVSLGQRLLGAVRQTFGAADASDVSRLIGRVPKDGDGLIFRRALHEAITVFEEPEWTMAFIDDSIGSSSFNFYGLVSSLSREEQERFARKSWDDSGRSRANVFLQFAVTSQPWSREFTTWFIPAIVAESKLERPRLYPGSLYSAALKMDLEAAHIPNVELKPEFEQLFEHWRQVIALRRSIRHSFPSPSKS